jgi:uncharacterized repeat protein (TIGR01451 family)
MSREQQFHSKKSRITALVAAFSSLVLLLVLFQTLVAQELESPEAPELQVTKTVDVAAALPGEPVQYRIAIANVGDSIAIPVMLTDTLPGALHSVAVVDLVGGGEYNVTDNVVTWIGMVSSGAEVTLDLSAIVTDTAVAGTIITNTAAVTGTGALITADAAFSVVSQPPPALQVTKTAGKTTVFPGGMVNYTIVVNNSGGAADSVTLTDMLPAELSFVEGSLNVVGGGSYDVTDNVITWTGAISGNGGEIRLSFSTLVTDSVTAADTITNVVTVTGAGEPITDEVVVAVQTTAYTFLPIIGVPLPTPALNPVGVPTTDNNFQTYKWTVSWGSIGVPDATYVLQQSRRADFLDATEYNLGTATSRTFEHSPVNNLNPYYYRVRAVVNGRSSLWSRAQSQQGVYFDYFTDNSGGWSIRRQDTDDVDNRLFQESDQMVLKIGGRWDYAIASPLLPVPWSSYSVGASFLLGGRIGNLHSYGIVFGGDWDGTNCPNQQYSSCFNHYYRLNVVWFGTLPSTDRMLIQLKRIDYHDPINNAGRGDVEIIPFRTVAVGDPSGWNEWRIDVREDGYMEVFVNGNRVGSGSDTAYVGSGTYWGIFASTDEYSGSEARADWFRVAPLR